MQVEDLTTFLRFLLLLLSDQHGKSITSHWLSLFSACQGATIVILNTELGAGMEWWSEDSQMKAKAAWPQGSWRGGQSTLLQGGGGRDLEVATAERCRGPRSSAD